MTREERISKPSQDQVRLEISVGAAARARLKISSRLLALARVVPDEEAEGKD